MRRKHPRAGQLLGSALEKPGISKKRFACPQEKEEKKNPRWATAFYYSTCERPPGPPPASPFFLIVSGRVSVYCMHSAIFNRYPRTTL